MFLRRLESGGYEKLGITDDSYINIPKNHRFARFLKHEKILGNDNYVKVNTKEFLNKFLSRKPIYTEFGSAYDPFD
jgi:hypothetical protein